MKLKSSLLYQFTENIWHWPERKPEVTETMIQIEYENWILNVNKEQKYTITLEQKYRKNYAEKSILFIVY